MIDYKFNEEELLKELKEYIDNTYSQHYASDEENNIQTFELISKIPDRGLAFALSSIMKYSDRFGYKKIENERKELMKIAHFAILSLYTYDKKRKK